LHRRKLFSLSLLLTWLLWACSSQTVKPDSGSLESSNQFPSDPTQSSPDNQETGLENASGGLPFPEVTETDSGGQSLSADSALLALEAGKSDSGLISGDASQTWGSPGVTVLPNPKSLSKISRPNGISQKPKPKALPEKVRVLVSRDTRALAFYSLGEIQIIAEINSASILTTLKGRFDIKRSSSGFEVSRGNKVLGSSESKRLRLVSLNPYNLIDLGGTVYRGGMHIIADAEGTISAINVLGVEDYLRGVLPYELGTVDREALEALKALAIVARTYVYKRMLQPNNRDFHVYSDVKDQVYKGVRSEYLLSDRAVWETRGMAVLYQDTLAQCYYYSTCSGRTASKNEVWTGESVPYLISRPDTDLVGEPFCQASKYSSWKEEWTLPQLTGILKRNLKSAGIADAPNFSRIQNLEVTSRASCGRIRFLKISTDRGPILIKGDKVRWALRPKANEQKILPSAWFNIQVEDGKAIAQGRGFGHGIGLCQVGSIARARAGENYKQIIEAYFAGVQLVEYQ
jgi:stage II sporulation protein D